MTEDIIKLAREAGFFPDWNWDRTNWHAAGFSDSFERFAALVRADEREAIAKMVEGLFDDPNDSVLAFIVDAIRARGKDAA